MLTFDRSISKPGTLPETRPVSPPKAGTTPKLVKAANFSLPSKYQFGCGILKMVDPKKQDFWPKINIFKGNYCILRTWGATRVNKQPVVGKLSRN